MRDRAVNQTVLRLAQFDQKYIIENRLHVCLLINKLVKIMKHNERQNEMAFVVLCFISICIIFKRLKSGNKNRMNKIERHGFDNL